MHFVGYACRHAEPPLRQAFLPLRGLTVLLGPNDSGKSSLLRAVERDLRGGHYDSVSEDDVKHTGGVFFAEVSDRELEDLINSAQGSLRRIRDDPNRGYRGRRPPWGLRGWRFGRLPVVDDDALKEDPVAAWLDALRDEAPDSEGFDAVFDALAGSRLVGLEPAGFDEDRQVWNVFWCLPTIGLLESQVADALSESPLRPFSDERERGGGQFMRGFYEPFHGRPRHLWVEGAPVTVAPIGQATSISLPRGLAVPEDFEVIRVAVAEAVNELTTSARHGLDDARREEPLDSDESKERAVPGNWLQGLDDGYRVHPDAEAACAFIAAAANRLLPDFISEGYRIEIVLRDLAVWFDGEPLDVRLRVRRDDGRIEEFPVEEVADGFRLWTQLALLEACEEAGRAAGALDEYASAWWRDAEPAAHAHQRGDPDADDLNAQAEGYEELFNDVRADLAALAKGEREWVAGYLRKRLEARPSTEWTGPAARHRRFFVVDEPERHLHPRRQREAATWLAGTTAARNAPCLVATHSTAFLSLPETSELSYVYVDRRDGKTELRPFAAGDLEGLDEAVTVLGFDRGELLTTVALFLVVEGRHDQEVLDRAFAAELRAAHIAVVPMDGVGAWRAVLDSHALWRYSTAAVALCTDKFDRETLEGLLEDEGKLRDLRRGDAPEETKTLAKLMGTAQQQGKTIHLVGHPGADLIDVLDEGVIRSLYPRYPGHEKAQRRWQAEVDAGAKARQRKVIYEREFAIPNDVKAYMALGDAHAEQDVKPPALAVLVNEAVELAQQTIP